jgi:TolA-binding protein
MNVPRYAAAAARLLGRRVPAARPAAGDRERGIGTIQAALSARTRRRRLLGAGGVLALAASALLGIALRGSVGAPAPIVEEHVSIRVEPSQGVSLYDGRQTRPLTERTSLEQGQRLETSATGSAALSLSTGTALELGSAASFLLDSQGNVERFSLERGRLSANVAKLAAGQRFIVATPDAEIEVRGTKFSIDVLERGEECGGGARSRLAVTEGVVEVRRGGGMAALVRAGQHWPVDCDGNGATALAGQPEHEPAPARAQNAAATKSAAAPASPLARANDLFAEGVALRRRGDVSGALRAYQDVMTRFPTSPLSENALVERMRLLSTVSSVKARGEAQRYLSRYPAGFAVEEARQLAAKP